MFLFLNHICSSKSEECCSTSFVGQTTHAGSAQKFDACELKNYVITKRNHLAYSVQCTQSPCKEARATFECVQTKESSA